MHLNKWLLSQMEEAKINISESIGKVLSEHSSRGVLTSSFAGTSCIQAGFSRLDIEIINCYKSLSELNYVKLSEFDYLYKELSKFIYIQKQEIIKETQVTKFLPDDQFISRFVDRSNSVLELRHEVARQDVIQRKRKVYYEYVKIVLTAIIAGLIGGLISKYIF